MAWVGIIDNSIIGPYFFPTSRVNAAAYELMLRDFLIPELMERGFDISEIVYMHDGAPSHITLAVRSFLNQNFQGFIGRGADSLLAWPPRSPDLNPLDFFLWAFVKSLIYKKRARTIRGLKHKIEEALDNVTHIMLQKVQRHVKIRYQLCVDRDGGLIEPHMK